VVRSFLTCKIDGTSGVRVPEGGIGIVFSFEHCSKQRVFISSNVPGSLDEETFVDSVEVPYSKSPVFSGQANVIP
jgi:hypothetical protein